MPLSINVKKKIDRIDKLVIRIAERLLEVLGQNLVKLETIEGWDGSNIRIIVKEKTDEVIEKIINTISKIEEKEGKIGVIVPDIVSLDEI